MELFSTPMTRNIYLEIALPFVYLLSVFLIITTVSYYKEANKNLHN